MLIGFVMLMGNRLNLEPKNKKGLTPLMVALIANKQKAVEVLLAAGADRNAVSEEQAKRSAVHIAVVESEPEILRTFLANGAGTPNLEAVDDSGFKPLYLALSLGKKSSATLLMDVGADIYESQAIHGAAKGGNTENLKLLLSKGVKLTDISHHYWRSGNVTSIDNSSPLYSAATFGDEEMVRCLVAAGDDPHRIFTNKTNLIFFCLNNPTVLRLFLEEYKVNPNQKSDFGLVPIQESPSREAIPILLHNGANPRVVNSRGR